MNSIYASIGLLLIGVTNAEIHQRELDEVPKQLIGKYILKTKVEGTKVTELPETRKIFCQITETAIRFSKTEQRDIHSVIESKSDGVVIYTFAFKDGINPWMITVGKKVDWAFLEISSKSGKVERTYGVNKE
ncbi:MAG: hypothetical protein QF473_14035 [Planctomycetota bacterium]|nr:hypothetical protein [Planctomycetota bacterium]MDP6502763.1 hypothetical protein [Planctomycetota bacterium]